MRGTYSPFIAISLIVFVGAGVLSVMGPNAMTRPASAAIPGTAASPGGGSCATCQTSTVVPPIAPIGEAPVAARREHTITTGFGASRVDPYYWLKEKENPEVLAYLGAENAYAEAQLKPLEGIESELFAEMEERANLPDAEAPYSKDGYFYQSRYDAGADYPVIVRRQGAAGPEEMVLNVPELATGHEQYFLRGWEVSPDGSKVAFAVDFKGDRVCEIFVRDIAGGAAVSTGIKDAGVDMAWGTDNATLYYDHVDETVRGDSIKRHIIGQDAATDTIVVAEPDTTFDISISPSASKDMAIITAYHLQRSEILALPLTVADAKPAIVVPRSRNARVTADYFDGSFYILTNEGAPDMKIVALRGDADFATDPGTVVVPETQGHYIETFALFNDAIAIQEDHDAMSDVRLVKRDGTPGAAMPNFGGLGSETLGKNADPNLTTVRVSFESATAPYVVYDVDLTTAAAKEVNRSPIWTWYDPSLYAADRIMAPAADGTQVPVTVIYRKDKRTAGGNPTLVYGYGAYGITTEPGFYRNAVSLEDRGFVFVLAHVRGGRDMGDAWYQGGRMKNKMNSFTDFIAASEAVIAKGYADPRHVYANGGSAGGLLMGAVTNLRGDLYDGVVAQVPFVDVLTTMLDDTIPLTTFEYEEWGNPNIQEQYEWMKAYSPYDNVTAKAYPPLFVLSGLNDSQVGYFEPAKWVAKLRATKTDKNPLLFTVNMGAGHSGNSGRSGPVADRAKIYAWLLNRAFGTTGASN